MVTQITLLLLLVFKISSLELEKHLHPPLSIQTNLKRRTTQVRRQPGFSPYGGKLMVSRRALDRPPENRTNARAARALEYSKRMFKTVSSHTRAYV